MPQFNTPRTSRGRKILYLGHTGSGKTGSLCSLAAAGYNVRILDLDAGTEVIDDFMMNKAKSIYLRPRPGLWTAEAATGSASRLSYVTITEGRRIIGAKAVPKGDSWSRILKQLERWRDPPDDFGPIASWTSQDVLVIDGLSRFCESAMNFQLSLNGRLASGPQVGNSGSNDYTQAYKLILDFLDLLKCDEIRCWVILICHIAFLGTEESRDSSGRSQEIKGFPQTVGRMISPKIGQYFNHAIQAKTLGAAHRIFTLTTDDHVDLKSSAPLRVKPSYDLATGLAEYFRDIQSVPYSSLEAPADAGMLGSIEEAAEEATAAD